MSVAYVVLAHRGPDQLARLVSRLAPAPIYLHIDRRTDDHLAAEMASRAASASSRVRLVGRHRSGWGSWGVVEAMVEGIGRALVDRPDHVVLLTGQDYLLESSTTIDRFSDAHRGTSFLAHHRLPDPVYGPDGGMSRVTNWHLWLGGRRLRVPLGRGVPYGFAPVGGQMQSMLSGELAQWVIGALDQRLVKFFRHCGIPDELAIPTLAMASPLAPKVANENLWFVRWTLFSKHPEILRRSDFDEMRKAAAEGSVVGGWGRRKLFARKFDQEVDSSVLDLVDSSLVEAQPGRTGGAGGRR